MRRSDIRAWRQKLQLKSDIQKTLILRKKNKLEFYDESSAESSDIDIKEFYFLYWKELKLN